MKAKDFKVYFPKEIKTPLIWFAFASLIGIMIQSLEFGRFVFIDFFWKNYILAISSIWQTWGVATLFGLGSLWFVAVLQLAYYLVMTISLLVIVFRLIATLDNKNTQKIVLYLAVIIGIILLISNYSPNIQSISNYLPNNSLINTVKVDPNQCPAEIIPDGIHLTQNLFPFTNDTWYGREQIMEGLKGKWADGQEMDFFKSMTYPIPSRCHQGSSEGENINLVYCNDISYSKSTTPISESGVIGKTTTVSYVADFVLEAVSKRDLGSSQITDYKIISIKCVKQ